MSRVPSSNGKKDGGSRSCSSPDLDIKPVRLSSSPAESSESDRGSRLASREKARREKRGRTQHPSSERRTAAKSFNKPDVTASVLLPRSSESSASSEEGSINVPVVSRQSVEGATEQTKTDVEEESQSTQEEESSNEECPSEKVGTQSHAGSSESCGAEQEPGKNVIKTETRAEEETDDQEGSSQEKDEGGRLKNLGDQEETSEEQSSDMEEGDHDDSTRITEEEAQDRMEDQGGAEEETDDQDSSQEKDGERLKNPGDQEETSEEQSSDVEEGDHDDSTRIPEEAQDMMEDQGEAEEQPNVLKSKDTEIQKQGPVSSQDEDEDEDEDEMEQDEEESSEDQGEETEESGDSEDVIITPQIKGSKQIQIISEEVEE
ncbi:glutamic acid-rich protein, partial [Nematolebias whitei]|uniref:glutamic acid-rich protein n=1 Tax=Nematolebias whitei TaxID=451745 RepID=UPI00189A32D1